MCKETESVVKSLPTNKIPGPNGFPGVFYQTFKEELRPVYLKLLQKTEEEKTFPNPFYKATIILIRLGTDKDTTGK